jgi:hypothetical protein
MTKGRHEWHTINWRRSAVYGLRHTCGMQSPERTRGWMALFLISCPSNLWESTPPRIWRASRGEIAKACGVSKMAVSKWCRALSIPTESAQKVLAERFCIREEWWRGALPERFFGSPEMLAMAWLLGLAVPGPDERIALASSMKIPFDAWDQPALAS